MRVVLEGQLISRKSLLYKPVSMAHSLPSAQADIGVKNGHIVGIGKGGNPDVMNNITPGMVVGVNTDVIAGEKLIVTAGAIDAHGEYDLRLRRQCRRSESRLTRMTPRSSLHLPSALQRGASERYRASSVSTILF